MLDSQDARRLDGMVLAAVTQEDAQGHVAAKGLSEALGSALRRRLRELAAMTKGARREEIRRLAAGLRAVPESPAIPPRARALLAADVPRELGRQWLAAAPRPRRGFAPTPGLRRTVRALAALAGSTGGDGRPRELAVAAELAHLETIQWRA